MKTSLCTNPLKRFNRHGSASYSRAMSTATKSTTTTSTAAVCFPGQGFQSPGMLYDLNKAYPEVVNPILKSVDNALNIPLSRYLLDKSEDPATVNLTSNAQPLLLTTSYTYLQIMNHYKLLSPWTVRYIFGHSLGEYTAWTAAGVLSFPDAVWLVRQRGKAMERATADSAEENGMTVLMIPEKSQFDVVMNLLRMLVSGKSDTVAIGNINSSNQVVLSGVTRHIKEIVQQLSDSMGKRMRTRSLAVSGAFHSPLMVSGKPRMEQILNGKADRQLQLNWPLAQDVSIISNITAKPVESLQEIKASIVDTLCTSVDWLGTVQYVTAHAPDATILCVGPGRVMKTAANDTTLSIIYVDSVEAIETLRSSLPSSSPSTSNI